MKNISFIYSLIFEKEEFKNRIIPMLFIIHILNVEPIPNFTSIYLSNNLYFIITPEKITYYLNNDTNIIITKSLIYNFTEEQKITTSPEEEMISLSSVYTENIVYLLAIKNFVYAINNGTTYFCTVNLDDEIKGLYPEVYGIKCLENICYFVIGIVNNKQIKLFLYGIYAYNNCPGGYFVSFNINNVASENVNCQLMQLTSDREVLTCFYQKEYSLEIEALSLSLDISNNNVQQELRKEKPNNGAKIIRSILSIDKKKSLFVILIIVVIHIV